MRPFVIYIRLLVFLIFVHCSCTPPEPVVRIHYLGHAAFFLQFDNGVSVLTDYGESNSYGLDSPVYDLQGIEPTVATFSHNHPDHRRSKEFGSSVRILTDDDSLAIKGINITPIRTCEASVFKTDNSGFLFTYKGFKILHLGDAQAYIKEIEQDSIKQKVKEVYPDQYDLLLMTIQGVNELIPQAEKFIALLQPKRVIPMHYWSPAYKEEFLQLLRGNREYRINDAAGAGYVLYHDEKVEPITVISLTPAAKI